MRLIDKMYITELALVFIASLLTLGSGYRIFLVELLVISLALIFFLGSWLIKEGDDEKIKGRENELHSQFGYKTFIIDDMRQARGRAIAGNLALFTLAAIYAAGINRNPDLIITIVALLLVMPIWYLIFRNYDYTTVVTPFYVEKIYIGFRHRFVRFNWENVNHVSFAWINGYAQIAQISIYLLDGYVVKIHLKKPYVRFGDLAYAILDHVPENRLDSSFLKYRQERKALKTQQASAKSIKIIRQGDDLYTAEVTAPNGTWRSPQPMPNDELGMKLLSLGYDPMEIRHALEDAGVQPFSQGARDAATRIRPLLQAVLAGEREVPPWPVSWIWRGYTSIPVLGTQRPYSEAKLAYALFRRDRMLYLKEVLDSAEGIDRDLPYDGEFSWAFLHLRRRGWLVIDGDMYGLTPEARRAIKEIVNRGEPPEPVKKLEKWLSDHPLPGDE